MENLFSSIEVFGKNVAIISPDDKVITYEELCLLCDQCVASLPESPGLIYIEAANELPSLLAFIGAARKGWAIVLLEPETEAKQLELRKQFPPHCEYKKTDGEWKLSFNDVHEKFDIHPDLTLLLSTSGSTGSAKLVRLSKANIASNAQSIKEYLQITKDDRAITTLPYFYSYGFSVVTSHLLSGASIVLSNDSVITQSFWDRCDELEVTNFAGVPRTFELLEHSGFLHREYKSLRFFTQAGGRLSPDKVRIFAQYAEENDKRFYVMYGQTEASPRISYLPLEHLKEFSDCIGIPIPGGELLLRDESGNIIEETNIPGELIYTGPNVMMGYAYDKADLALESGDQVLPTGDIAIKNERGLFKIVGRKSRFVKISGLRISLDTIEESIRAEGITAVATGDDELLAIAVKDTHSGEKIQALLESKFKIPPGSLVVLVLDETPLLPNGKTDYQAIIRRAKENQPPAGDVNLRRELARILRIDTLEDADTFSTAGGDSINYIEGAMVVEKYFGHSVTGWENIPIKELEEAKAKSKPPVERADYITICRSIAVTLAMLSHCFIVFSIWEDLSDAIRLITRTATPALLTLTGLVLAKGSIARIKNDVQIPLKKYVIRYLPTILTLYGVFGLVQLCALAGGNISPLRAIASMLFISSGSFGNILTIYTAFFIFLPGLMFLFERYGAKSIFFLITASWGIWFIGHYLGISLGYPGSLFFGFGDRFGPSVLQGITLVAFGYTLGLYHVGREYRRLFIGLLALACLLVLYSIKQNGWAGFITGISTMDYRAQNHPYYYSFGLIVALLLIVVSKLLANIRPTRATKLFLSVGENSIFVYGFGNMVINLIPRSDFPLPIALPLVFLFMILLIVLTNDVNHQKSRPALPITPLIKIATGKWRIFLNKVVPTVKDGTTDTQATL